MCRTRCWKHNVKKLVLTYDFVAFSGNVCLKNLLAQLTALIAELEASSDPGEVFDTLMCLRDDVRDEQVRLVALNDCITRAEDQIEIKELEYTTADIIGFRKRKAMYQIGELLAKNEYIIVPSKPAISVAL
ncbi:hypothetical protein Tco_0010539 [Tanacetum coccineum]